MDSYNEILSRMKNKYKELSGFDVPPLSDIDIRLKVLAGEIYNNQVNLEFIKRQMFPKSATGEYLDLHASDRGLVRKKAVKATGTLRFYLALILQEDLIVPKGTIVATSGSDSYRYVTQYDCVIKAGSAGGDVYAVAEEGGINSNVLANTVNVVVTTIPGISKVTNITDFTGGTDSESDESLRERILDSYITISNGTNKAYYKKLAMSVPGVTDAYVVPKARGVGTVNVYIASNKKAANYETISSVQSLMDTQREINVDVLVNTASPISVNLMLSISVKDGYDFSTVSKNVSYALREYISNMTIGEDILENHLGNVVYGVEGVFNYTWDPILIPNYAIDDNAFAVAGTIEIKEE